MRRRHFSGAVENFFDEWYLFQLEISKWKVCVQLLKIRFRDVSFESLIFLFPSEFIVTLVRVNFSKRSTGDTCVKFISSIVCFSLIFLVFSYPLIFARIPSRLILQRTRLKYGKDYFTRHFHAAKYSKFSRLALLPTKVKWSSRPALPLSPPPSLPRLLAAFCLCAATLIYDHLVHNLGVGLADSRDATFRRLEGAGGGEKSLARVGLPRNEQRAWHISYANGRNVVPSCIQYYRPAFLVLGSSADFYGSLSTSTRAENQL